MMTFAWKTACRAGGLTGKAAMLCGAVAVSLSLTASPRAQESDAAPAAGPGRQSVTTTTTAYGNWEVVCTKSSQDKRETCAASFRVVNQQSKANLLIWMFGRNDKGKPLTEIFTFPEVLIAPGVAVSLEGAAPLKAEFVSCSGTSCKAAMTLDTARIRQLKQAKTAKIAVTQNDGKVLTFNLDVAGLGPALGGLGF